MILCKFRVKSNVVANLVHCGVDRHVCVGAVFVHDAIKDETYLVILYGFTVFCSKLHTALK